MNRSTRQFACAALTAILLVPSLGYGTASAQGLQAGITRSTLTNVPGVEPRQGLAFGASLGFLDFGALSLAPGFYYVQKGARLETPTESGIEDLRVDWIEVPVMLEFGAYIRGTPLRPSIAAGPYFGFRTGCSFGFEEGDRSEDCLFNGLREFGIDGVFDETDLGWTVSGGLALYTGQLGVVSVGARYAASLSDVTQRGSATGTRNRTWTFLLGWSPL